MIPTFTPSPVTPTSFHAGAPCSEAPSLVTIVAGDVLISSLVPSGVLVTKVVASIMYEPGRRWYCWEPLVC